MTKLVIAPTARQDLLDIFDYIARDKRIAAADWVKKIEEKYKLIAATPEFGERRPEYGAKIRSSIVGRFVISFDQSRAVSKSCASSRAIVTSVYFNLNLGVRWPGTALDFKRRVLVQKPETHRRRRWPKESDARPSPSKSTSIASLECGGPAPLHRFGSKRSGLAERKRCQAIAKKFGNCRRL